MAGIRARGACDRSRAFVRKWLHFIKRGWLVHRRNVAVVVLAFVLPMGACNAFLPWSVPPEAKERKNPVAADDAAREAAAKLYALKCAQCHGLEGRGDGPEAKSYSTKPADFTDQRMMDEMTDGEIFYKITTGRRPMPAYEKQLTETERWQLVHFIRTFARKTDARP